MVQQRLWERDWLDLHSSNFCKQLEQRSNLWALLNLILPFDTPFTCINYRIFWGRLGYPAPPLIFSSFKKHGTLITSPSIHLHACSLLCSGASFPSYKHITCSLVISSSYILPNIVSFVMCRFQAWQQNQLWDIGVILN